MVCFLICAGLADLIYVIETSEGVSGNCKRIVIVSRRSASAPRHIGRNDVSNDVVPAFLLIVTEYKSVYMINIIIFVGIEPNVLGYGLT